MSGYIWVDPPAGWKYGFPKLWDQTGDVQTFILSRGYPQALIDGLGDSFYVGMSEATVDDIESYLNAL